MKPVVIIIITLLFIDTSLHAQTRTIQGRIVSENLEPLFRISIQGIDTTTFGETDLEGRFKVEIPQQTQTLLLYYLGFEETIIKLKSDCDTVEIVMLLRATYDFMSPKQIDRNRLKRFNKLPEIHLQAFTKGLFSKKEICYSTEFKPDKPYYDEIKRQMVKKEAELKPVFEKVSIGDTIKIPFNEQTTYIGSDEVTLFAYTAFTDCSTYDCVIKGVVIGKNKRHKGYNLMYKVIDCGKCRPSNIYKGKAMQTGEIFTHDMRHRKVFID